MMIKNKRNLVFIFTFVLFNILSTFLISIFQVYQRYIDLNSSIVNGVNLAIKNGILLSDIRGSLKDIADSYLSANILSSSRLISNLNNVEIIRKDVEICESKNIIFRNNLSNEKSLFLKRHDNFNFYFCFNNKFFSNYKGNKLEIANWMNGYPVNYSSLSGYLKHIFLLSLIFSSLSILVLYKLLQRQEFYRKKQITQDIISRLKHEINRPISKIQSLSKIVFSSYEKFSEKDIRDKLYQIYLLTKTHSFVVNSMFSYALNKNDIKKSIEKNNINLYEILEYCISISIRDNVKKLNIKKDISDFFRNNLIIMDKTFLEIAILNILTNAYEAVYRNSKKLNNNPENFEFEFEFKAIYDETSKKLNITLKNYGSYIDKDKYDLVFKPGVTSSNTTNTGYGLSILSDIVSFYDGSVELTSNLDEEKMFNSWVCFNINFNNIDFIEINKYIPIISQKNYIKKLNIIVADDDFYFLEYFKDIFQIYSDIFEIKYFLNVKDSINYLLHNNIDIAILDLKFEDDLLGGVRISKVINCNTKIVFHSSSLLVNDNIENKNFEYFQKTISRESIIKIIDDVYKSKYNNEDRILNAIIIDDENYIYKDWEVINTNVNFIYFTHFDQLFDSLDSNILKVSDIDVVITDFYFDKVKAGLTLYSCDYIGSLKNVYDYKGFIILASNTSNKNLTNIDIIIDKNPIKIRDLLLIENSNTTKEHQKI